MSRTPAEKAAIVMGLAALISPIFWFSTRGPQPIDLVFIRGGSVIVLPVLGLVAIAGGLLRKNEVILAAGAGLVAASFLQLVQAGRDTNWLGGNGSTLSFMGGLGLGLLAAAVSTRLPTSRSESTRP